MKIQVEIPTIEDVVNKGIPLRIALANESWSQNSLGNYAKKSGVYVHHKGGSILYVGQTSKGTRWGTFHVRLRRECQPKAASNSNLYQLLALHNPGVLTTMYDFEEIKSMFSTSSILSAERMTLILEQFMIAAYKPIGNRR